MYSLSQYKMMISSSQKRRENAYSSALQRAIRPDSVVLDLGAGFGYFSLLAASFGARKVFSIEPSPALAVGKELAKENGLDDHIVFLDGFSQDITLDEPATILVADLRGSLPLYRNSLSTIIDARERHLTPNAQILPRRDILYAALISAPRVRSQFDAPAVAGLTFGALQERLLHSCTRVEAKLQMLRSSEVQLSNIDYCTITSPSLDASAVLVASQASQVDGILVWFESYFDDTIVISNHPRFSATVYGQSYYPLQNPLSLYEGEEVHLLYKAHFTGIDYVVSWIVETREGDTGWNRCSAQSTLFHLPPSAYY